MIPPDADNSGLTILNNATNVTHWGLGAGVGFAPSTYKGDSTRVLPFPLVYFDNKWVRVIGTTADLKIGSWSGVSVALRGQFSLFDGYACTGTDATAAQRPAGSVSLFPTRAAAMAAYTCRA